MFHLRAFVSERLSAAAVDIFGEVEKSLSLYQVEVSRSREEIILLRQQLELLRDNNTDPLQDHKYIPPVLQENSQGPPGTPEAPVDEKEETEDYRVTEILPGPSEKTEHDVRTRCTVSEPNPEIPQIKEEQDQFTIEVEVCPSPDVVKSEPDDRDGAEMEITYRSLTSDDGDEETAMGEERQRLCAENQKLNELNVAKGLSDGNEQVGVKTTSPREEDSTSKPSCHFCGKSFRYIGSLMKHIQTHGNAVSKCSLCGKTCASTEELLGHLYDAHSNKCDVCGRTFSMPCFLIAHAKTHTGVREHVCNICGTAFSRKDNLVSHARTHSGEKPYSCDICGKAFSQRQHVTMHRRIHTGEKPYQCSTCDKLFSTSSHLKVHMRYHADEKPYTCDVCGKQFRLCGQLTRHKRIIHGGERLHVCKVCGVRFKYAQSLKAHLKTHEKTSKITKNSRSRSSQRKK